MTPEQQRIAIAQIMGYTLGEGELYWLNYLGKVCSALPDYLYDLNVMHQAVKTLDNKQLEAYRLNLLKICTDDDLNNNPVVSSAVDATAAQRAEAFLKAIGQWVDFSQGKMAP